MLGRWLVLLLVALPGLAAAAEPQPALLASSVSSNGASRIAGTVAALEVQSPDDRAAVGWTFDFTGNATFTVESAEKVSVDTYAYQPKEPTSKSFAVSGPWHATQWMNGSYLFLRDAPGASAPAVEFRTVSATLQPAGEGCAGAQEKYLGQKLPACRGTADATAVEGLSGPLELVVHGPFEFVAWGWTLGNGSQAVQTGRTEAPVAGLPSVNGQGATTVRWTTLHGQVAEGAITIRPSAAGIRSLLLAKTVLATDGLVIVKPPLAAATGEGLQFKGRSVLEVESASSALSVEVLDSEGLAPAPATPPLALPADAVATRGPLDRPSTWTAAVGLSLAALAAAALVRRRRNDPMAQISRALDAGRHDEAASVARQALPSGAGVVLEAIASIKAGRLDEAKALVADPAAPVDPAARHFLLASIAATRNEDDAARSHLRAAFRHDDAYRLEASLNGQLKRVLDSMQFREDPGEGGEAYS